MCNRYPDCLHGGPVIDKVEELERHCETPFPNQGCPYIKLGCRGCQFRIGPDAKRFEDWYKTSSAEKESSGGSFFPANWRRFE